MGKAARNIEPLNQGDLDGLCGIYAIINAIRVLYPKKFSRNDQDMLFQFLTEYAIKEQGNLGLIHAGLGVRHMQELVNVGLEYLSEEILLDVDATRPWRKSSSKPPLDLDLMKLLFTPNTSLIIGLERPSQHWTVIKGYDKGEFLVFDSEDHENIPCSEVQFTRKPTNLYEEDYIISASSIFVLQKG